jgi:ferrous iron transport protein A
MSEGKQISLVQMEAGKRGILVNVQGGHRLVSRLAALGIRPGKRITKISSMFMRGPVTIQVDNTRVAIGFGMAKRMVVKLE